MENKRIHEMLLKLLSSRKFQLALLRKIINSKYLKDCIYILPIPFHLDEHYIKTWDFPEKYICNQSNICHGIEIITLVNMHMRYDLAYNMQQRPILTQSWDSQNSRVWKVHPTDSKLKYVKVYKPIKNICILNLLVILRKTIF